MLTLDGELLARIQRLEDVEAVQNLHYRYCAACDDNYDADGIAAVFTEDGVWDGGEVGRYEGRSAIVAGFAKMINSFKFVQHIVGNPIIQIHGDTATCQSRLWLVKITNTGSQTIAFAGRYHNECIRQDGQWLIKRLGLFLAKLPTAE